MPGTAPFEAHHRRYDDWFVRHAAAYQSELLAVRALLIMYSVKILAGVYPALGVVIMPPVGNGHLLV